MSYNEQESIHFKNRFRELLKIEFLCGLYAFDIATLIQVKGRDQRIRIIYKKKQRCRIKCK